MNEKVTYNVLQNYARSGAVNRPDLSGFKPTWLKVSYGVLFLIMGYFNANLMDFITIYHAYDQRIFNNMQSP